MKEFVGLIALILIPFILFGGCIQPMNGDDLVTGDETKEPAFCDIETPCAEGDCYHILQYEQPVCLADPCAYCVEGEDCMILESYPGQVVCKNLDLYDDLGGDVTPVSNDNELLSEKDAFVIAEQFPDCSDEGKLTLVSEGVFDEEKNEWVFGLEGIPEYCFAAECRVNALTKESRVQWMCGMVIEE